MGHKLEAGQNNLTDSGLRELVPLKIPVSAVRFRPEPPPYSQEVTWESSEYFGACNNRSWPLLAPRGITLISAKLPPSTIDREVNRCHAATFSEELLGSRECDRGLLVTSFEAKRLCPDPRLPICFGWGATRICDGRSYREAPYASKPAEKFSRNFRGW